MSFRFRRFLFYSFFLFFVLASVGIVMYASGWRIDFGILAIKKTGGLYIETIPKDAVIEINNEQFPNRSGLIKSGTLITNLLSKTYQVEISREGYFSYHKNILVKPSLVAELINVVLVPEEIKKTTVASQKIKGNEIIDFSGDSKKFIVKNQNKIYYLHNLSDSSAALNINMALNNAYKNDSLTESVKSVVFHPFDSKRLIIEASNLYIFEPERGKLEYIFKSAKIRQSADRLVAWSMKNSNVYLLKSQANSNYQISSFNLMTKTENAVFEFPEIETGEIIGIAAADSGNNIAIINNLGDIYILDIVAKNFQKIAHDAKIFSFSPDSGKIAFIDNDGKLNIHFLENQFKNNFRKAGETIRFDLENKELIENIYWHKDSHHLFVMQANANNAKSVIFAEIDDRLPLNQYPIAGDVEDFYYNQEFAYFIQNMRLYKMEL
ncbi:MAG: hypothetical protein AAB464_02020 [Patescibacteria group bacterium]